MIRTNARYDAVVQETLYLLAVPDTRAALKKGRAEPLTKSAKALAW